MGYADVTTIYAVIPKSLSWPQVMESLNQDLTAINSWCLKLHMRLNPKKTKSMVVSRFRTIAPSYGALTLGGTELEDEKSLRILVVTLDSKMTSETHLWKVVSRAARSLGIVRRAGKLFACPRVLKELFQWMCFA